MFIPTYIFGAGGLGRECWSMIRLGGLDHSFHPECIATSESNFFKLKAFVDDAKDINAPIEGTDIHVIGGLNELWEQITDFKDDISFFAVIIAVGNPQSRKKIHHLIVDAYKTYQLKHFPGKDFPKLIFPNLIHPRSVWHKDYQYIQIGQGNIIAKMNLSTHIKIADFCFLNTGVCLQHDATIGSYCTLMPNAVISGGATLEEGVYLKANESIMEARTVYSNSPQPSSYNPHPSNQ